MDPITLALYHLSRGVIRSAINAISEDSRFKDKVKGWQDQMVLIQRAHYQDLISAEMVDACEGVIAQVIKKELEKAQSQQDNTVRAITSKF